MKNRVKALCVLFGLLLAVSWLTAWVQPKDAVQVIPPAASQAKPPPQHAYEVSVWCNGSTTCPLARMIAHRYQRATSDLGVVREVAAGSPVRAETAVSHKLSNALLVLQIGAIVALALWIRQWFRLARRGQASGPPQAKALQILLLAGLLVGAIWPQQLLQTAGIAHRLPQAIVGQQLETRTENHLVLDPYGTAMFGPRGSTADGRNHAAKVLSGQAVRLDEYETYKQAAIETSGRNRTLVTRTSLYYSWLKNGPSWLLRWLIGYLGFAIWLLIIGAVPVIAISAILDRREAWLLRARYLRLMAVTALMLIGSTLLFWAFSWAGALLPSALQSLGAFRWLPLIPIQAIIGMAALAAVVDLAQALLRLFRRWNAGDQAGPTAAGPVFDSTMVVAQNG